MAKPPITIFTFGYAGWGNSTRQLIKAVDSIEQSRGYAPPIFVDVRLQRSVRAIEFSGSAFEKLLGSDRHRWMPELGNRRIRTGRGRLVQIAKPDHAKVLLDLATERASGRQRVIFFCGCPFPPDPKRPRCHRYAVGQLLHAEAERHNLSLQIEEWPGDESKVIDLAVSSKNLEAATRCKTLAIGPRIPSPAQLQLPWGSVVNLHSGKKSLRIVSGPAHYRNSSWMLPIFDSCDSEYHVAKALKSGLKLRSKWKLDKQQVNGELASERGLSPYCVYTIIHPHKLRAANRKDGKGTFHEGRRWVAAAQLLQEAKESGNHVPILLADATDCSRLTHWGLLTRVKLTNQGTTYSLEGLKRLRNRHPQELYLRSTQRRIAPNFIRPYAICMTPDFLNL